MNVDLICLSTYDNIQHKLDLSNLEDVVLLTYQIKDIRNLGNNNASYSKTITLPGTKTNNEFFNSIFDFNVLSKFNANLRTDCRIEVDGLTIFQGYLQLNTIRNNNGVIEYEVTLFSSLSDFITKLGDLTLADLNFNEYNHDYIYENIVGSWSNFYYKNGSKNPFNYGEGYVYPYLDYGFEQSEKPEGKTLEFFRPQLYLKVVLDKIFNAAGYVYTSEFFNSLDFKKILLINNFDSYGFDRNLIIDNSLYAGNDDVILSRNTATAPRNMLNNIVAFTNDSTNGFSDPQDAYDLTTYKYTIPQSGYYDIQSRTVLVLTLQDTGFSIGDVLIRDYNIKFRYNVKLIKEDSLGFQTIIDSYSRDKDLSGRININGQALPNIPIQVDNLLTPLSQGDKVYLLIDYEISSITFVNVLGQSVPYLLSFKFGNGSEIKINQREYRPAVSNIKAFDEAGQFFKNNTKLSDLFISVCKLFNLHIVESSTSNLIIEPYDNFYNNNVIDLSKKMDRQNEIALTPTGDLVARRITLTYKSDGDYYNQTYINSANEEIYGQKTYDIDNEFFDNDSEELIEIDLSASPIIQEKDKFLIPIYTKSETGEKNTLNSNTLRIAYYNGPKECSEYTLFDEYNDIQYSATTYPYAGHFDNIDNPTLDLNPFFARFYFYNATATNNNLFNKYYYNYFYNKVSPNSLLLSGLFKLSTYDVYNLDFRNIYYIDGSYFILNKVIDYNPVNPNLTKLEFIKLLNNNLTNGQFFGGDVQYSNPNGGGFIVNDGNEFFGGEFLQQINPDSKSAGSNNTIKDKGNMIIGYESNIGSDASGNLAIGNNNKIAGGSEQTLIQGENNYLAGGNNFLFGKNNELSTNDSFVIGDNIKNIQSGAIIMGKPVINQADVINASRDEVLNPFGQINTNILIVSGSRDSVRQIGGLSNVMVIQSIRN